MSMATVTIDGLTGVWLPFFFYYLGNWKLLFLGNIAIVVTCLIIYAVLIPESPRFYLSRHKYRQARDSFATIAKYNQR